MTKNNAINTPMILSQFLSTSSTATTACSTALPRDDTIPQNTEGDEIITLSITPVSSTSTLIIQFHGQAFLVTGLATQCALFQDSTANALAATGFTPFSVQNISLLHTMTSGTTSSTTFKIRFGNTSGSATMNTISSGVRAYGGIQLFWLTIKEYL